MVSLKETRLTLGSDMDTYSSRRQVEASQMVIISEHTGHHLNNRNAASLNSGAYTWPAEACADGWTSVTLLRKSVHSAPESEAFEERCWVFYGKIAKGLALVKYNLLTILVCRKMFQYEKNL